MAGGSLYIYGPSWCCHYQSHSKHYNHEYSPSSDAVMDMWFTGILRHIRQMSIQLCQLWSPRDWGWLNAYGKIIIPINWLVIKEQPLHIPADNWLYSLTLMLGTPPPEKVSHPHVKLHCNGHWRHISVIAMAMELTHCWPSYWFINHCADSSTNVASMFTVKLNYCPRCSRNCSWMSAKVPGKYQSSFNDKRESVINKLFTPWHDVITILNKIFGCPEYLQ